MTRRDLQAAQLPVDATSLAEEAVDRDDGGRGRTCTPDRHVHKPGTAGCECGHVPADGSPAVGQGEVEDADA